jgi:hypothetical protein
MEIKQFDVVRLLVDKGNIKKGTFGSVQNVFLKPTLAYEVEFIDSSDIMKTLGILIVTPEEVERVDEKALV